MRAGSVVVVAGGVVVVVEAYSRVAGAKGDGGRRVQGRTEEAEEEEREEGVWRWFLGAAEEESKVLKAATWCRGPADSTTRDRMVMTIRNVRDKDKQGETPLRLPTIICKGTGDEGT